MGGDEIEKADVLFIESIETVDDVGRRQWVGGV
jgi:hypothetical protein